MARCSFCGRQVEIGRGIIYVEISGRVLNFCSSKCKKNHFLGRDGSKIKWAKNTREEKK